MMKLKIDVFGAFLSFSFKVLCVGGYLMLVSESVLYIVQHVKRKSKTAFPTNFKTVKLKADT